MTPKFSLQPVLDYRETRVEILEIELSRLLQAKQRGLTFLEALNSSRDRLLTELGSRQKGEIDLFFLERLRSNLKTVGERIVEQENRLVELEDQVKHKNDEVVIAKQESEALVKLKNKEIKRYHDEESQKENRLQDDIYIARAHRQVSGV